MSILSGIGSILESRGLNPIGDDNSAIAAEENNPFLSAVVLGARTTYDALNAEFETLIQSKKTSLLQVSKALDKWIAILDKVASLQLEMSTKLDDVNNDISGTFTLDFASEAWEVIQDTPILRRYMGEANYWYLHDMLGVISTMGESGLSEALQGVKASLKAAVGTISAALFGLISLDSYLGYIQSAWGFLYVKVLPISTIDSVLPNVTTAYWYKPSHETAISSKYLYSTTNEPPGNGFSPVVVPVPNPSMAIKNPTYIKHFSPLNPDTWYLDGEPYYMPNTMDLLYRALNYWGSSYTDAYIPVVNDVYPRRTYGGGTIEHPLQVGRTFSQLDTSKMSIGGSHIVDVSDESQDISSILGATFTEEFVAVLKKWQGYYEKAYYILVSYLLDGFKAYGENPTTIGDFVKLQAANPDKYTEYTSWVSKTSEGIQFAQAFNAMMDTWRGELIQVYAASKGLTLESVDPTEVFDHVMSTIVKVGKLSTGLDISLSPNETFMVGLSFDPTSMEGISNERNANLGIPYIAYLVDTLDNHVTYVYTGDEVTIDKGAANVEYGVKKPAFVMFPSNSTTNAISINRSLRFNKVLGSLQSTVVDVPTDISVGQQLQEGTLTEYMLIPNNEGLSQNKIGPLVESLHLHRSCGYVEDTNGMYNSLGNLFFPDGAVPTSLEIAAPYPTVYTVYMDALASVSSNEDELADVVGYSINRGRETKFPCFGIYGNLLCMASWQYKEMPWLEFVQQYSPIKSKSSLYFKKMDPSNVVYYHSSYYSKSRDIKMAVYHKALATETKSYGDKVNYTYYVYPGESVSVYKLSTNPVLRNILSVDATDTTGEQYHYTTLRNPIPKCAKYVDPMEWSFMDVVYELLLSATNLAGLCGDNGERLETLMDNLSVFGVTIPEFIGELPKNNGQSQLFAFNVLQEYADKIDTAIGKVYNMTHKLTMSIGG